MNTNLLRPFNLNKKKSNLLLSKIEEKLVEIYNNIFDRMLFKIDDIHIYKKSGRDIVSNLDFLIESELRNFLKELLYKVGINEESIFLSEESYYHFSNNIKSIFQEDKFIWIVDPLDGTVNFANFLPFFSTSVALYYGQTPILGLVFAPKLGVCYRGIRGFGAKAKLCDTPIQNKIFLLKNKEIPIQVSEEKSISNSLISVNLTSHYSYEETNEAIEIIKKLNNRARGVRIFVSGALEMCFVADGRLNGFISNKADIFSIAAAFLIVKESGGKISDFYGKPDDILSSKIIVSNEYLLSDLQKIVKTSKII